MTPDPRPTDDPRDSPSRDLHDEDLAAAPDHDVPNEEVIEKTLPEPGPDDTIERE